ncbi:hypothetical protein ACFQJC_03890 [Haloferax namakaokahaiae]|uniref:Uncharacterized protein n=1 Tax=Haloferax namakaokahaiae TaxID=1748331 RepID=A0ABD5ZBJ9_9EURY
MDKIRYDAGDIVPEEVTPASTSRVFMQFAVPVEIYYGFGRVVHIYPTERIEDPTEIFAVDDTPVELLVTDDVQLYTTPPDELQ